MIYVQHISELIFFFKLENESEWRGQRELKREAASTESLIVGYVHFEIFNECVIFMLLQYPYIDL